MRTRGSLFSVAILWHAFSLVLQAQFTQQRGKLVGTDASIFGQGYSVALSGDGNTAVVGSDIGAFVYTRSGSDWSQQQYCLPSEAAVNSLAGTGVAISTDGSTIMIGGKNDNGGLGAVWVFVRSGNRWSQQGGKLVGTGSAGVAASQGSSVALSADGNTAVVGGPADDSSKGAVWIWVRSAGVWNQHGGKLTASDESGNAQLGQSVSISADGNTVAAGSAADNSGKGAAWAFTNSGGTWTQQGVKIVAPAAGATDNQGRSVALSSDGNTLVSGAPNAGGHNGGVFVFSRSNGTWTSQGGIFTGTGGTSAQQGTSVAISASGKTFVMGGPADDNFAGAAWVFTALSGPWAQVGSKLVGNDASSTPQFGGAVAISGDGFTLLAGGVSDNSGTGAGWVFTQPSSVAVTNGNDSGAGSLRQAVLDCPDGGTVDLSGIPGDWILSSEIVINKNLTITGAGDPQAVRWGSAGRIFFILGGNVTIRNLKLNSGSNARAVGGNGYTTGAGAAGMGGAIFVNRGANVTMENLFVISASATGGNGGNSGGFAGGGGGGFGGDGTIASGGSGGGFGTAGGQNGFASGDGAGGSPGVPAGGNAGFGGGGGGGAGAPGGAGGTGGGGGGGVPHGTAGRWGGDGGDGGPSGGGGGAGLGGAVAIRAGATVTVLNGYFTNNSATGGSGGAGFGGATNGANGQGKGGAFWAEDGAVVYLSGSIVGLGLGSNSAGNAGTGTVCSGVDHGSLCGVFLTTIANNGGDGQSVATGHAFPTALSVKVSDGSGHGTAGAVVTFRAPGSGASGTFAGGVPTATAVTDINGIATAPAFTAGAVTGSYAVVATAGPLSVNFGLANTVPVLSIAKSHTGIFTQGQQNATYTVTVSNAANAAPTSGTVTVTETVPSGLTLVSMTGSGWTCPGTAANNCTRSDSLTASASYSAITVTVNVGATASSPQLNSVTVSGGESGNATATDSTTIVIGGALRFVPITPCRVVDTRHTPGPFGGPPIAGNTSRDFALPNGACNIPPGAQAYALNVTAVPPGPLGFLTIWPTGQTRPVASTLNSVDGRVKANAAIVPAGSGGAVSVYASNTTDVVLDINGYFVPGTDSTALAFYPLTPCRIADTRRTPAGPLAGPSLAGGQSRTFPVQTSSCNIPSTAQAYSLNFAAVPPGALGFLTVFPTGQTRPTVSTLNDVTATVVANAAIVPAGTSGSIDVFASNNTDVVIDVDGYFAPMNIGGLSLYGVTPCRVLNTRQPPGSPPITSQDVNVTASACGIPAAAQAYVFNVTAVPSAALGFLTLWPQGQTRPTVSTLNAIDEAVTSNMALVPTSNGSISIFASNLTHVVMDILGYFGQ